MAPMNSSTPGARRTERRETSRVLLIDPDDFLLLIEDSDPGLPGPPIFWITPGGGIDLGETAAQAAIREVAEETGHRLADGLPHGPVAHRNAVHGYSDKVVKQTETYFVARVPRFDVRPAGLTDDELLSVQGHRWWSVGELQATDAMIWPAGLAELVEAVLDGAAWPVELPDGEESTVPA